MNKNVKNHSWHFYSFYGIFSIRGGGYMRIAICEDCEDDRNRLRDAINDWAKARHVNVEIFCYSTAEIFIFKCVNISFDLIFLDIELSKMSGVKLAEYIRLTDKNVLIVFETNFTQYVFDGYDVNAFHYLIKPLSQTKLIPILDKANLFWRDNNKEVLIVSNGTGQIKLPLGSIFYIEVFSHIAEIHANTEVYKLRKTITEFENLLPKHFMRCYRSIIINLLNTDCVYKNYIKLSNGNQLMMSRNYSKLINDAFMQLFMG